MHSEITIKYRENHPACRTKTGPATSPPEYLSVTTTAFSMMTDCPIKAIVASSGFMLERLPMIQGPSLSSTITTMYGAGSRPSGGTLITVKD